MRSTRSLPNIHLRFRLRSWKKCKAQPQVRTTKDRFHQYAYSYHFKFGTTLELNKQSEALVTTASLGGSRKERIAFEEAVNDVMWQTKRVKACKTDFLPCHSDPCLQVADYCAWAIQRKWESEDKSDTRSYTIIKDRITYEYDLFAKGKQVFY
jgi:Protein of unknown function (DUF3800)